MDPYEVGTWRFCPACGGPVDRPDGNWPDESDAPWCRCCGRPWQACPCEHGVEGQCEAATG